MNVQQKNIYIKDIYQQFIESIQNKCYSKNEKLYKHRIIPGFEGGTYCSNNVLLCNYKDHCLAHYYRMLAYKKLGDKLAWRLMISQNEDIVLLRCRLVGKARGEQQKREKSHFFSQTWQAKYGARTAGKRNVKNGHIKRLNQWLTKYDPIQRSNAGKLGGQANQKRQRQNKTHFYNPNAPVQKLGNFVRWGIKIDKKRVAYKDLNSLFIEYHKKHHLINGTKKEYTQKEYQTIIENIKG
jgi:hypothetical protein